MMIIREIIVLYTTEVERDVDQTDPEEVLEEDEEEREGGGATRSEVKEEEEAEEEVEMKMVRRLLHSGVKGHEMLAALVIVDGGQGLISGDVL